MQPRIKLATVKSQNITCLMNMNTPKEKQIEACNLLIDALISDEWGAPGIEPNQIFQSSQLRREAETILTDLRARVADKLESSTV